MVVFPNCKINLGLQIVGKRADGFHDLQTIFYPVPINDALEIVHSANGETSLQVSGITIDAHAEDNICMKAYRLLQQEFPDLPPVLIHLHKNIPSGAGLGGGSADGAFMLLALNQKFNLQLSSEQLIERSLQLGSDCPFFIINKPCYATGRGEQMEPVPVDLSGYQMVLVNPKIHINTGWAFKQLIGSRKHFDLRAMVSQPLEQWADQMPNDFEAPVFAAHPEIAAIKERFLKQGALFASMTGTGSTVYAFFDKHAKPEFHFPEHYLVKTIAAKEV